MRQTGREYWAELVALEFEQRNQEGCDVESVRQEVMLCDQLEEAELRDLYEQLLRIEIRPDFGYSEPSDWEGIQAAAAPGGLETMDTDLVDGDLYDRLHGGWLGRCVACLLGKPSESLPKDQIEHWLLEADAYPLDNYFPRVALDDQSPDWLRERFDLIDGWSPGRRHHEDWRPDTLRGAITQMVRDDDLDYPVMRLDVLDTIGLDATSMDLAESLNYQLPYRRIWSAERSAYRNVVNGIHPPDSASVQNPHREAIGAMTRADLWGYVYPGQPQHAVERAYQDAAWSHTKNGIYGELFAAAAISAAFATSDPAEIVLIGLRAVPTTSRLYEAIDRTVAWSREYATWGESWLQIDSAYGHYDWAHTIPNVCWIVLGLLYGGGDFTKSVGITVMCGMATDSTAATVGSILGVMHETDGIPEHLRSPLNDRLASYVVRSGSVRISDLARRTLDVIRKEGTSP